jgi:hypothetical protein
MTRKFLSLATVIGLLYVFLLSQLLSDDALFLVVSDNNALNAALLALATGSLYLSYMDKLKSKKIFIGIVLLSVVLSISGTLGFLYASIDNYFNGLIKPLDYIVTMQLGVLFGLHTLVLEHQPLKIRSTLRNLVPAFNLPNLASYKQQVATFLNRPIITPPGSSGSANVSSV